jgi:hypothetical protein
MHHQWPCLDLSCHTFIDQVDLTVDLLAAQGLESLARAEHAQGFARGWIEDNAMHGAAQVPLLFIEDRVVHAVQTPHHVNALIQVGVNLAAVSQDDRGLRCFLEPQWDNPMLMLRQVSTVADQ